MNSEQQGATDITLADRYHLACGAASRAYDGEYVEARLLLSKATGSIPTCPDAELMGVADAIVDDLCASFAG